MRVGSGYPTFGSSTDAISWTTTEMYSIGLPAEHSHKGKMRSFKYSGGHTELSEKCNGNLCNE
jgi:hypothetical protein